jgi:transcriptional regulator with XRE-family HTH domain
MDLPLMVRQRLNALGVEQRDLANAAQVTESYISQLLTRKKAPPAPNRTDIYLKMERFLKLPSGELSKLADLQHKEALRRRLEGEPLTPLFKEVRALILRKCHPHRAREVRAVFEKQAFGELERLVTQTLLEVVKRVAKKNLESDRWLRTVARLGRRSYEEMRVVVLEFLDTNVFNLSPQHCMAFWDPVIESWDIQLATFEMDIVLNPRLAAGSRKRFAFVEREAGQLVDDEAGLKEFLGDPALSGDATEQEIEFLRELRFRGKRPTRLYYYRALQNVRDPLHFRTGGRRGN